jgi:hypothetical protein
VSKLEKVATRERVPMETPPPQLELNPDSLPTGTEIGTWRIVGWRGRGAYGTVYRVMSIEGGAEGPFALKMAYYAMDRRFERERELLSRICHPNVPRLQAHGVWQHPGGAFPYLVMEWLEGLTLYEWAARHPVTSRQVLRVLAQIARALEATHAIRGVHRDVKGDNILVRAPDGHVSLLDFGAGDYRGAVTLTEAPLPPGTLAYRSPEAWAYQRAFYSHPSAHYEGTPCDDLFALGVAAYRLVTGEYPPPTEPGREGAEVWRRGGPGPRPPRALNAQVCPELESLILRLMAVDPVKRFKGQARQAAEALEYAAENAGPAADVLLPDMASATGSAGRVDKRGVVSSPDRENARPVHQQHPRTVSVSWVAYAALAALGLSLASMTVLLPMRQEMARLKKERESRGEDSVGVGDSAELTSQRTGAPDLNAPGKRRVGLPMPERPFPDQRKPPCGENGGTEIRGGCWHRLADSKPPCSDDSYAWMGECYMPARETQRQPTSGTP